MLVSAISRYLADFCGRQYAANGSRSPVVTFQDGAKLYEFRCQAEEPTGISIGTYWFDMIGVRVLQSYARDPLAETQGTWLRLVDGEVGSTLNQVNPAPLSSLPPVKGSSVRPDGGNLQGPLYPFFPRSLWEPAVQSQVEELEKEVEQLEAEYLQKEHDLKTYRVRQLAIQQVVDSSDFSAINLRWWAKKRVQLDLRVKSLQEFVDTEDLRPQILREKVQTVAELLRNLDVDNLVRTDKEVRFTGPVFVPVSMTQPLEDDEITAWKWVKQAWSQAQLDCVCDFESQVIIPGPIVAPSPPVIRGILPELEIDENFGTGLGFITVYDLEVGALALTLTPVNGVLESYGEIFVSGATTIWRGTQAALNKRLSESVFRPSTSGSCWLTLHLEDEDGLTDEAVQRWSAIDRAPTVTGLTGPASVDEGELIEYVLELSNDYGGPVQAPFVIEGTSKDGENWVGPAVVNAVIGRGNRIDVLPGFSSVRFRFQTIRDQEVRDTTLVFSVGAQSVTTLIRDVAPPALTVTQILGPRSAGEGEKFEVWVILNHSRGGLLSTTFDVGGSSLDQGLASYAVGSGATLVGNVLTVEAGTNTFKLDVEVGSDFWTAGSFPFTVVAGAVGYECAIVYVSEYVPIEIEIDRVNLVGCAAIVTLKAEVLGSGTHSYEWEQLSGSPVTWLESRFQLITTYEDEIRDDKRFRLWVDRGSPYETYRDTEVTTVGKEPMQAGRPAVAGWSGLALNGTRIGSRALSNRVPALLKGIQASWEAPLRPALTWPQLNTVPATPVTVVKELAGTTERTRTTAYYLNLEDDAFYSLEVNEVPTEICSSGAFFTWPTMAAIGEEARLGPPVGGCKITNRLVTSVNTTGQLDQDDAGRFGAPLALNRVLLNATTTVAVLALFEGPNESMRAGPNLGYAGIKSQFKTEGLGVITIG